MGFMDNLLNAIRNKYLNATGAERDLLTLIKDKDITQAQTLMQNRDTEVLQAIQEYNPELHRIMRKADKMRKGQEPYRTEKLPRARQKYINEVELFFLLGNPIRWKKVNNEGSDEAFEAYNQFLQDTRFNVSMRKAKRIAGAETECAKLYHIYRDENFQPQVKVVVICKSKGYTLRPLFDLYENLIAFGYGYYLKEGTSTIEHFDIQTPDTIYRCKRGSLNWEVIATPNPTGKINVIYYRQDKAWGGLNPRIDREEDIDSKISDTNNYFADPIAAATGDVVDFFERSSRQARENDSDDRSGFKIRVHQSTDLFRDAATGKGRPRAVHLVRHFHARVYTRENGWAGNFVGRSDQTRDGTGIYQARK